MGNIWVLVVGYEICSVQNDLLRYEKKQVSY